jgi:ring-1,2-phenylacetyl-CoA epoxidase subunit PaaD
VVTLSAAQSAALFPPVAVADVPAAPVARRLAVDATRVEQAWAVLETVLDPEVPALSLCDLGIVRAVQDDGDGLTVVLTPTYSGCPATEVISQGVVDALSAAGLGPVRIEMRRAPAWTTDWISDDGRRKLREYGIAPPGPVDAGRGVPVRLVGRRSEAIACPRCNSLLTERLSAFGSTACKSLYRCVSCREPFEHFKPL